MDEHVVAKEKVVVIYEYECTACKEISEINHSMKAKPRRKCPLCKKMKLRRLISGGNGFQLKGGGWYADGYASKPKKARTRKTKQAKE